MRRVQVMATLDYPRWWPEMARFTGQRIVITGGAGGIGVATARTFLEHGAHVLLVDLDAARLAAARRGARHARGCAPVVSDLDTPADCAARSIRPAGRSAALIHLAGLFERDPLEPEDHGVWDRAIAANLTNAYDMAVAFIPRAASGRRARAGADRLRQFARLPPWQPRPRRLCRRQGRAGRA